MIRIAINGELNPQIAEQPQLSQNQREVLLKVVRHNPDAAVEGLDRRGRPIVWQWDSSTGRSLVFAVMRNGQLKLPRGAGERWDDGSDDKGLEALRAAAGHRRAKLDSERSDPGRRELRINIENMLGALHMITEMHVKWAVDLDTQNSNGDLADWLETDQIHLKHLDYTADLLRTRLPAGDVILTACNEARLAIVAEAVALGEGDVEGYRAALARDSQGYRDVIEHVRARLAEVLS